MKFVRVRSDVKSPMGRDLCLVYGGGETTGSEDHLDRQPGPERHSWGGLTSDSAPSRAYLHPQGELER